MDPSRFLKMALQQQSKRWRDVSLPRQRWENQEKFEKYLKILLATKHRNVHVDGDDDDDESESVRTSQCVVQVFYT